ncbi:hypothetical protein RHGRI_018858 [Rhododendron griersonianum]|uniref:Transmembrane protein n=1 Tax=Rhododendron griersonianum TaxID=479676 RepID=A0AAV6K392_9ERIC|nr:hypothetical protein RHGRI_018858 [Rhododendron griersonianum]
MRPSVIRSGQAANGYYRRDEEAGKATSSELRSQKCKKWLLYGVAFVILPLTCQLTLNGKVDLMFIFKRKKVVGSRPRSHE